MSIAFVLISTGIDVRVETVLEAVKKVEGVAEAYDVYGVYDIIAKVRADNMDKLKEIVTFYMRRIIGVRSTQTMIVTG